MGQEDISSAGDHFLIGLQPSPALTEHDRMLLSDLRPAGVILFKSNFHHDLPYENWLQSHARLIAEIRAAARRPAMLIGIDHEGGRVCRTPAPITRFSYAAQWAGNAAVIGSAMGLELASLGVNLSFSPVLDIHTNPRNPVIGERAFGKTPEAVIAAALPFMMAMQRQKILVCGKHFPGHGDTNIDSHIGLPRQNIDLDVLRARELKPFAAAIEADIPMIMTSHILFPEVDRGHPVTLSHRFLTGILRGELGFEGAIISDDIGMGAMKGFFDGPDSAVRLLQCGCDMVMVCSHFMDTDRAREFARAIVAAAESGQLDPVVAARSKRRVKRLLERAQINVVKALPDQVFRAHAAAGPLYEDETAEVI